MANTEGIPDEHVASLLSLSTTSPAIESSKISSTKRKTRLAKRDTALKLQQQKQQNPPHFDQIDETNNHHSISTHELPQSSSRTSQITKKKSKFRFQRERMMELTDGMKPSAKVIRASKPESPAKITPGMALNHEEQGSTDRAKTCHFSGTAKHSNSHQRPPIMLSESIFERTVSGHNMQHTNFNSKLHKSHFKQKIKSKNHNQGFPSLDLPVGAFIPNKMKTNYPNQDANIRNTAQQSNSHSQLQSIVKANSYNDDASNQILNQMSSEEINKEIQELKATLSPDVIDFLRQRGKKKKGSKPNHPRIDVTKSSSSNLENYTDEVSTVDNLKKQQLQNEKEEIARILSSISTMEDLDQAVLQQQQHEDQNEHNSNILNNDSNGTKSTQSSETDIETCTSLLRSTSSHQRLLAAKTISKYLKSDLKEYVNSRYNKNCSNTLNECQRSVSYPSLLPVALRCLLDLPSPHKNIVLHGHVLQSLYSLILLHSSPENYFIYDMQRTTFSKLSNQLPELVSRENGITEFFELYIDNPSLVYQYFFLEDNIPTSPPAISYTSSSGSNNDENTKHVSNFLTQSGIYATGTSVKAASLDGIAFYNDPMWTMLSRMKIIPCIANLLHFCHGRYRRHHHSNNKKSAITFGEKKVDQGIDETNKNAGNAFESHEFSTLKEENWISICGILTLLSLRSPGAACAIAQHNSILNFIVDGTLSMSAEEQYGCGQDVQHPKNYSGFVVNTKIALPTLILLCTLARQSRTAACAPPFANIMNTLQAILGMKAETNEEHVVQFYSITLWRILLR